jgi:signal peptidase II
MKLKKNNLLFVLPALIVIILDQASKFVISRSISYYESIPVIEGFFNLVHVRNRGMAFGLLNRPHGGTYFYFLIAATILAIILMLFWFTKLKHEDKKLLFGLSLILGGAAGNLIDRIRIKEVVDFADIYIGSHHWPAFNIADSAISMGTVWIAINILFFASSLGKDDEVK